MSPFVTLPSSSFTLLASHFSSFTSFFSLSGGSSLTVSFNTLSLSLAASVALAWEEVFAKESSGPPRRLSLSLTMASTSSCTMSASSSSFVPLPFTWLLSSLLSSGDLDCLIGSAGATGAALLIWFGWVGGRAVRRRRLRSSARGVGRYWGTLWAGM